MTTSEEPPSDEEIVKALKAWFKEHGDDPNRWRTPIGRTLKELLQITGNWKNAPRGNPKKGFRAMQANQEEQNT